ncbi:MAG: hypothetical protein Q4G33_03840 [bacterium]|nr:hypothetical protein [bacterium]
MEMQIRLTASDLQENGVFDALKTLCTCFAGERYAKITPPSRENKQAASAPKENAQSTQVQSTSAAASSAPTTHMAAPKVPPIAAPTTAAPNVPPIAAPTTAPPTAAANFSGLQVAQAAAAYAETSDAARQNVVNLIHSFGAQTLNEIPPDKLGEFATGLRGLGARI